ncbi:hypothetical protein [Microvirga lotononidis]|uniref:Uncharacterized protein n=1 Tax=Microvirga lotononidis TaxID=864069 RepID=I4YLW2_9HYPH|nr:hypothetical protein [Microvirga lotononidis]EIM24954.1 hypothetical protein MicloDRAFT_00056730 [Microvirga lotononidis]WQO29550.1 hypothetical protein U0023_10950 [Microvirga lotononidis]
MASHRFKVGDQVRLVKLASTNTVEAFLNMVTAIDVTRSQDVWEVTRLLPADRNGFQYHIKGDREGPARLVREEQLQSA